MRGVILLTAVLAASAVATAVQADEPLVTVDCLCIEKEHGWLIARGDTTMEALGLNAVLSGSSILRFAAAANGCTRYASLCSDDRYTPMTGEIRALYQSYGVSEVADDFKLTIQADVAKE
jgi:hypothetical protein